MVERGSDRHGFAKDEELKREVENELRAVGPTRSEEWREPELWDREEEAEIGLDAPLRSEVAEPERRTD